MSSKYPPLKPATLEDIRECFIAGAADFDGRSEEYAIEFDRWLAEHDREVRAAAFLPTRDELKQAVRELRAPNGQPTTDGQIADAVVALLDRCRVVASDPCVTPGCDGVTERSVSNLCPKCRREVFG